jgi:hypothetical protein
VLLVVVVDQRVLPVLNFQAVLGQRHQLTGTAAGVAQDLVGRLEQLRGRRRRPGVAVGAVGAQQVQVGVELGDHRLGDCLADLLLVGLTTPDRLG